MMKNFKYDVVKLLENVKERPCLWDKTLDCYKNREERKSAWEEIFRILEERYDEMSWEERHATGEMILNKWTNVRDTFVKTLKPKMGKPKKRYGLYNRLKFLLKVIPEAEYYNQELSAEEQPIVKQEIFGELNNTIKKKKKTKMTNVSKKIKTKKEIHSDDDCTPKKCKRETNVSHVSDYVTFETADDTQNDMDFGGLDYQESNGRLMNEDEAFFASLLPTVVKYNEDERLEFRIEVLAVMKKIKDKRHWQSNE